MKKLGKGTLGLIILSLFISTSYAQTNVYQVLASYGKILVQKTDGAQWVPIATGNELIQSDMLKVAEDAYLGLIGNNGNTLELNKQGTYKVSDLTGGFSASSGATQKYAALVLSDMTNTNDQSYMYNMTVTGALERSVTNNMLQAYMPRTTNLLKDEVTFSWFNFKDAEEYVFTLTDRYARRITQKSLRDTLITINLDDLDLKDENCYYWAVSSKENPKIKSEEYCIYKLSEKARVAIRDTLDTLNKDFGENKTALNCLILASFYEKNNLLNEAMVSYEDAISKAPQVEEYKKSYALFLIRIGLFDEARKLWD
ncbi:MAG: hypothetical protein COC01_08075 [Bacteroidetes bacterium]|nr:hypothetical protein [Sphingobacteriaceae bacterium AH-315-L07]PCH66405.1 MAG: hypothetical protein COC01_08075 [Bacteroidota bacterium]